MDTLSSVFSALRLSAHLYFQADLRGDFAVELPKERRHIRFHLVLSGTCRILLSDGRVEILNEGDLVLVPNGARQVLAGGLERPPVPLAEALTKGRMAEGRFHYGADGVGDESRAAMPGARLLCGFCRFDESLDHPLLAGLPAYILFSSALANGGVAEGGVAAGLDLMRREALSGSPGMEGILTRLLEILMLQSFRDRAAAGHRGEGFAAALSDPQLARALNAFHDDPSLDWTLAKLAAAAGQSRARFAAHFKAVIGLPPAAYLRLWRILLARQMLTQTDLDVAEIAVRCGYRSLPSFSARFKKETGMGPGAYRRSAGRAVP